MNNKDNDPEYESEREEDDLHAGHEDDSANTGAAENEDGEDLSPQEKELDGYYNRIPKFLTRITLDNAERHAAVDLLLKNFEKINTLQAEMGIDSQIDLPTIFDMAANGGGEGDIEALREANAAFAEENEILASAVETLSYQVKTMRGQAADEIIEAGLINKDATKKIKKQVESVKDIIATLEKYTFENTQNMNSGSGDEDGDGRSYDERLTAEILELENVSLRELQKDIHQAKGPGKILRRFGLSYDDADIYAVRQLLLATLEVNREQNRIIESLKPLHTQLEKIHQMIELVELLENHDIRQEKQYQEAMEQIEMLNRQLEKFQEKYAEYSDLERDVEQAQEKLESVTTQLEKDGVELERLQKSVEEYKKMEAEFKRKENSFNQLAKSPIHHDEEDFEDFDDPAEEVEHLRERIKNIKLHIETREDEIAKLNERLRDAEDPLMIKKLRTEVENLKEDIKTEVERAEEAEKEKESLEGRIPVWVKEQPALQEKVRYWRKKSMYKYSAIAVTAPALAATAAYGGYLTHTFMVAAGASAAVTSAWLLGAGVPAILGSFGFAAWKYYKTPKHNKERGAKTLKAAFIGAAAGAAIGAFVTGLSYTGFNAHFEDELQQAKNQVTQQKEDSAKPDNWPWNSQGNSRGNNHISGPKSPKP